MKKRQETVQPSKSKTTEELKSEKTGETSELRSADETGILTPEEMDIIDDGFDIEKRKIKKKRKNYFLSASIKSFVFVSTVIVFVVCMALFSIGVIRSLKSSEERELRHDTYVNAGSLVDQIGRENNTLSGKEVKISDDLDIFAQMQKGRIILIGRDYRVLKDTYGFEDGKYIIGNDVFEVMKGDVPEISRTVGDYVEIILPVKHNNVIIGTLISTAGVKQINIQNKKLYTGSIWVFIAVLVIGILSIAGIAYLSVRELNRINRQIYEISEGDFQNRLKVRGFKETRYLADNYNAVLKKLDSIDSTRQEFVSNVSHELKTPITSMKVLAESIQQNDSDNIEMYREFMSDIVDELDRETKMINDLLTLVKTDRQNAVLNIEEKSINELIEVIIKRVTPIADKRGIKIIYESYRDVTAEIDEVKLSLALSNLIENAVKYNVDNGWVKISLNADVKSFYLKIADSGVGIPDDAKEKVFDRFYRVDKARSRDTGGTGLGLAIARNAIVSHDGNIRLYSEQGKGTTFTVRIPIKHEVEEEE
ncbi:sensor histidine kinase [Eubacterium ruminantium]|uniref:sensor histidine kinase n=1 Tax=Eubacterium ruminantium TaxID=42322 RepID=UPI001568A679|nr:HAMP domain-containing sensor histidine kinase [Eubacterium ruminantium]